MEWQQILQAVLSLIFVIGLLLLTLWAVKYCEFKGAKNKFFQKLKSNSRLDVIEIRRIDSHASLALLSCDEREILVLLSSGGNLLISENSILTTDTPHD